MLTTPFHNKNLGETAEERKYEEIESELAKELQYDAKIRAQERKLREIELYQE
jgi:hypothetical protein